jgi:type IV conjugative transfer system protein TraE
MNINFLQENITKILSQRNSLFIVAGILSLSNVLLGVALVCRHEKIILVPPHITKTLWVQGGEVSKEYLEEMGLYMSKLLLDLSPTSFAYNHAVLLKYATPEAYGELKKQLIKDGEQYTKLQLSTHFKPAEITAYPQTLEVTVKGQLISYVAGKQVRDSQESLFLKFTHREGGIFLESVTGGIPNEH